MSLEEMSISELEEMMMEVYGREAELRQEISDNEDMNHHYPEAIEEAKERHRKFHEKGQMLYDYIEQRKIEQEAVNEKLDGLFSDDDDDSDLPY